jgi:hypothetical protein
MVLLVHIVWGMAKHTRETVFLCDMALEIFNSVTGNEGVVMKKLTK